MTVLQTKIVTFTGASGHGLQKLLYCGWVGFAGETIRGGARTVWNYTSIMDSAEKMIPYGVIEVG